MSQSPAHTMLWLLDYGFVEEEIHEPAFIYIIYVVDDLTVNSVSLGFDAPRRENGGQDNSGSKKKINTCNSFYCDQFEPTSPTKTKNWTEDWPRWFQIFGEGNPQRHAGDVAFVVAPIFEKGGSVQNYQVVLPLCNSYHILENKGSTFTVCSSSVVALSIPYCIGSSQVYEDIRIQI